MNIRIPTSLVVAGVGLGTAEIAFRASSHWAENRALEALTADRNEVVTERDGIIVERTSPADDGGRALSFWGGVALATAGVAALGLHAFRAKVPGMPFVKMIGGAETGVLRALTSGNSLVPMAGAALLGTGAGLNAGATMIGDRFRDARITQLPAG